MTVTGKVCLWLRHHHIENLKSALLTMPQFAIKFHTNSLLFVAWPRPSQSRRPVSWLYPCKITSSSVLARREGPAPRRDRAHGAAFRLVTPYRCLFLVT